jgi:hypothetical protein
MPSLAANLVEMYRSLLALSLAAAPALCNVQDAAATSCKAIPGSADWPAPEVWAGLNQLVGGQLIKTVPPGAVCHAQQPSYNVATCGAVLQAWSNEFFHSDDPVSVEWNNWNNDTCLPIPRYPCSGEGYPVYVVNATTAQHVKAGVDFG